jgi:hypothetical protein
MWPFKRKKQPVEVINKATVLTIPGPKVRVTLVEAKYFSVKDLNKLKKSLAVLAYVLNDEEFKTKLFALWIENRAKGARHDFTSTTDTTEQVYEKIMKANELNTGDDNEVDFSLEYYNSWWSKVIGYTLPSSLWIWLNWKYHLHFTPAQTAGNLAHEFLHKLGYGHSSAKDYTSVPYSVGYLVEELGTKYEQAAMDWVKEVVVDEMWRD